MAPDTWHDLPHSLRPLLRGLVGVLVLAAAAAWAFLPAGHVAVLALRIAAPALAVALAVLLILMPLPEGNAPDLLAKVVPNYFDRGGLCFAPKFVTDGGSCYLCLYFQNHYRGHASSRIALAPPAGWFGFGAPALAGMTVSVECPGGAFGVAWMHYGVSRADQGRRVVFHVAASTDYRQGRGERLSHGRGTPAGPLRDGRPGNTRAWILLPSGVPEVGPAKPEVEVAILWQPDLPTGGFPVLPVRSAA